MSKIFAGLLLAIMKFGGSEAYINSEFVGFLLIYLGCREVINMSPKFEETGNFAFLAMVLSVAGCVVSLASRLLGHVFLLRILTLVLGIVIAAANVICRLFLVYIAYLLIDAVKDSGVIGSTDIDPEKLHKAWIIFAAGEAICAVLDNIHLGFMGFPAGLAALIASIYLLKCFWKIKVAVEGK